MADHIYLDHAATTPVLPAARAAIAKALEHWANPSSPHTAGRAARAALENARGRIAAALGWRGEVIFTSGATEAIALAIRGRESATFASTVEHDAVFRAGAAERIAVGPDGLLDPERLDLAAGTLLAVQSANNETGVMQPIDALADRVAAAGALLLVDASQTAGKISVPDADFVAVSAHKLGGPPGVGALLVRDLRTLAPAGGQERGYRAGTENLPAILGFAAALEARQDWLDEAAESRSHLERELVAAGGKAVGADAPRIATIGSYRMPGVTAAAQLIGFDMAGIAVSAGSACSSGSLKPSHVLMAMGWSEATAREVVRVSFGPQTTREEIDRFVDVWSRLATDARRRAA